MSKDVLERGRLEPRQDLKEDLFISVFFPDPVRARARKTKRLKADEEMTDPFVDPLSLNPSLPQDKKEERNI